jgi:hypothetical protein
VNGQFVAFDTANYTFSAKAAFTRAKLDDQFTALNNGLTLSAPIMPPNNKNLANLISALAANHNYTVDPSKAAPTWGAANPLTAAESNQYQVYSISCRSCHATQRANRWSTAEAFVGRAAPFGASPTEEVRNGLMPNVQRTYSIFWGSASAKQLLKLAGAANANTALSQPETVSGNNNPTFFK